jgi:hypothetical protein
MLSPIIFCHIASLNPRANACSCRNLPTLCNSKKIKLSKKCNFNLSKIRFWYCGVDMVAAVLSFDTQQGCQMVCGAILEGLGMEIAGHLEYVVTYITAI